MDGSSEIISLDDAPGGGQMVTMYDPDHFPINLIYGQIQGKPDESNIPKELVLNYEMKKARIGAYQRFTKGPAAVHRVSFFA